MTEFWVIDTKVKVSPESSYEQDGSEWYYGRSVVPARSVEEAIQLLSRSLKAKHVYIENILAVINYDHQNWNSVDDEQYKTTESYEKSKEKNDVVTAVLASGLYLEAE
ncbi:hypothetical protein EDC56_0921 [Sinobacterium caligoides]|uniref:Uncharacterized protein n=1 Tax=Sinobacterium caligoides TaxID=933926 RepID=A0A3N2DZU8_9GAMM|nr:hypothetical protein [Sinobacterium caligoides]ROS05391.1 hypothetical protein EDC56_0921 [Sinobacterium caligoides]